MNTTIIGRSIIKLIFYRTLYSQSAVSITMSSLGSYLKQKGFVVDMCLLESGKAKLELIDRHLDDAKVCIMIAKPNFKDVKEMLGLLDEIRKDKPNTKIFLCGPYAKLNARQIMNTHDWIDGILMDQPEKSCENLLNSLGTDLTWNKLPRGVMIRNHKQVSYSPIIKPIPLDDLPFPLRDLESIESGSYVNIEMSRGCDFACSFCHVPHVTERLVRNPKLVVDEIEYINKKFKKTLFIFNDSVFWGHSGDNERILDFADEINNRQLDIHMYVYLRCYPLIPEYVLDHLTKAGLVRVFLGIENVAALTQRMFNKRLTKSMVLDAWHLFSSRDINIHIGYIVYEPYSTLEDVKANIDYLYNLGKMFRLGVVLEPLRVIPGSRLHRRLLADGLMKDGLSYHEITYGYTFKDVRTGVFLSHVRNFFSSIYPIGYQVEYYCTVLGLLQTLCKRTFPEIYPRLTDAFIRYSHLKNLVCEILYNYFQSVIQLVSDSSDYNLYSELQSIVSDEIAGYRDKLSSLFLEITDFLVSLGYNRIVKELYHAQEYLQEVES